MHRSMPCVAAGLLALLLLAGNLHAAASSVLQPDNRVDVYVNQGVLIDLGQPAKTLFVAEPDVASYQISGPSSILLFGRNPGITTFMAMDEAGTAIYTANVHVDYNIAPMQAALKREFPSLVIKITPAADGIIVSGEVPSPQVAADVVALLDAFVQIKQSADSQKQKEDSASSSDSSSGSGSSGSDPSGPGKGKGTLGARNGKVINRLTVTMPTQVTIHVRIAEVSRSVSEQLGIKWFWRGSSSSIFGHSSSIIFGLAETVVTTSTPFSGSPDFSALIDALAAENMVSILAEPNLSVVSGETASFLAGGQIPYVVPQSSSSSNFTIQFKDYGILLNVSATVLSRNRVSLRIRPEVSEPSTANGITFGGVTMPGFNVRRAETTIELASGQSFAIGGLLKSTVSNDVNKIPGLGDIPILGALFRSTHFQRGETELVIIATAYIGKTDGVETRIPNARMVIPGMFERLIIGSKPSTLPGKITPSDLVYY